MVEVDEAGLEVQPCESCGTLDHVSYGPDPYQHEINDDDTPMWKCRDCRWESAMDI